MLSAGMTLLSVPEVMVCGVVLLIPVLIVLGIFGAFRGGRGNAPTEEDRRIAQEIYGGLDGLEKRVESLETILLDRTKER